MPYIKPVMRDEVKAWLRPILSYVKCTGVDSGTLNYIVTNIMLAWIGAAKPGYQRLNAAIGVLECVKQELYRRTVASYEDEKIIQNGDIRGFDITLP